MGKMFGEGEFSYKCLLMDFKVLQQENARKKNQLNCIATYKAVECWGRKNMEAKRLPPGPISIEFA